MDQITFNETEISGVLLIKNTIFKDLRGEFVKIYQKSLFDKNGLNFDSKENFYSVSDIGVIRGLHFQSPPYAQEKLIYVPKGKIFDVVFDLRINSLSYGKFISVILSEENNYSIYIPAGCAHGFQSLENRTITVYSQGAEYNPACDNGINPLSVGIDWPLKDYILSQKDANLKDYISFQSPFKN